MEKTSKHYLVIPLAGFGRRFADLGYKKPKQMLELGTSTTFSQSMSSINFIDFHTIFILRKNQLNSSDFDSFIKENLGDAKYEIHLLNEETRGSLETVVSIQNKIEDNSQISIFTMDVSFSPVYQLDTFLQEVDSAVLTFKANNPAYSYAKVVDGKVTETAEKVVISNDALVGIYYFKNSNLFFDYAKEMLKSKPEFGNEYYIAPLLNYYTRAHLQVEAVPVDYFYVFGTPEEYEFHKNYTTRMNNLKKIGLCSDHSGFNLKEEFKTSLREYGYEVIDFGTYSDVNCDYNDFVYNAALGYKNGEVDLVIGSCKSGQGVAMAAGKYPYFLPTVIYNEESLELARAHSCSNFLSFPSMLWDKNKIANIIKVIESTKFEGGRHQIRLMKTLKK